MVPVFLHCCLFLRVSVSCGAGGRCPKACGSAQSRSVPGHWQGNKRPAVGLPTLFCPGVTAFPVSHRTLCVALTPSSGGAFLWVQYQCNNRSEGAVMYRDDMEKEGNRYAWWSNGKIFGCQGVAQVYPGQHVMQTAAADQYLPVYCELQSDIWGGKYVSWSVCLLTFPLCSFPLLHHLSLFSCCFFFFSLTLFILSSLLALPVTLAASPGAKWLLLRSKHVRPQFHPLQHWHQLRYSRSLFLHMQRCLKSAIDCCFLFLPCTWFTPQLCSCQQKLNIMNVKCSFLLCTDLLCTGLLSAIQMCWIITWPAAGAWTVRSSR